MINQPTQQFILTHREADVRQLALLGSRDAAVDLTEALQQIQGWQTARHKLPLWAACHEVVYPPHLNMEQCSSEQTALYKQGIVRRLLPRLSPESTMADLTGGFGVDFFYLSRGFAHATYVERNEALAAMVRHNLHALGDTTSVVRCAESAEVLQALPEGTDRPSPTLLYLDPARRGDHGQKVFGLSDCEPDVTALRAELLAKSDLLLLKLSPMLDWHEALRQLCPEGTGCEVHIVSVGGECKELLLAITRSEEPLRVYCANDDELFVYTPQGVSGGSEGAYVPESAQTIEGWLLVPNASIMKAGCFREVAAEYGLRMVDRNSHLFVADGPVEGFPGRQFRITRVSTMNRRELREALQGVSQANIATRNFPLSVAELRKRLKLRDGGSTYLFATTWGGRHIILVCERGGV